MKEYLVNFYHANLDFRIPEFESLCEIFNVKFEYDPTEPTKEHPFMTIKASCEEDMKKVASRSMLIRAFFELWGKGDTYEECIENVKTSPHPDMESAFSDDKSFKYIVEGYGAKLTMKEQLDIIDKFAFLPLKGPVDLKNPDVKIWILEDWGLPEMKDNAHTKPEKFKRVFLFREVAFGNRKLVSKYDLKKRTYLGPTSMNAEYSLLISNQAKAQKHSLVWDPFVGTGSLILTSAEFGSAVMGGDIDPRVLQGKGPSKTLLDNFKQKELPPPLDIIRCDNSRLCFRPVEYMDAIVADPPYGIRAGGRKMGSKKEVPDRVDTSKYDEHIPQTVPYPVVEVLTDLLNVSAKHLVIGGRLVYWLPTMRDFTEDQLPAHGCFKLVSNSEQVITRKWSRRLITMEKIKPYDPTVVPFIPKIATRDDLANEDDDDAEDLSYSNLSARVMNQDERRDDRLKRKQQRERKRKEKAATAAAAEAEAGGNPSTSASATTTT
eukprot:GFYU01003177.1.p1 GENE.GFYU01003177.1~~GFYU01003177.1.p1  ORF type:complete len:491 (-),score=158.46 GFYU01003177.1:18-1490(-)